MKNEALIHLGGRKKVSPQSIVMLKADINYTTIHFDDGSCFMSSTTIGVLENRLKNLYFFRPNRPVLINLNFMKVFEKKTFQIKMENNEVFKIARRRTKSFEDLTLEKRNAIKFNITNQSKSIE